MQIESTNEFPPSSAVAVPAPPAQRIGPAQGSEEGAFSRLLSPIRVGTFDLPNRVVMGSMHMSFYDARAQERLAEFYAERARAGVALIVTGGVGVNAQARLNPHAEMLTSAREVHEHQPVTAAVHEAGSRILLQLIHAGRYAQHDDPVAPSAVASPLSGVVPREMTSAEVDQCADDFARAALLARQAGYDGVELMGAEGYLISEFLCECTNRRQDEWGGSHERRMRFAVEVARRTRQAVGVDFLVSFRMSMLDLVEKGQTLDEVVDLARALEKAGVDMLNTGIGWHEAKVPTIAHMVPRGTWRTVTGRVKRAVTIPVAAGIRINTPELAEESIVSGDADMVTMARPFLADPEFVLKLRERRPREINTCIGCNQACLDYYFGRPQKPASCLVNPRAGRELDYRVRPAPHVERICVIGAGAAGLSCAITAAARGHKVTLYEASPRIGGQLNWAMRIPGKSDFTETLRYYSTMLEKHGVVVKCATVPTAEEIAAGRFAMVVVATGVRPRVPDLPGLAHSSVLSYIDVLERRKPVGRRVAIIGAGGIGFDVAEFLAHGADHAIAADDLSPSDFFQRWGIDCEMRTAGGLLPAAAHADVSMSREITLLQRKAGRPGATLGKTTGWALKADLAKCGVRMLAGVEYQRIDDAGLHLVVDGRQELLEVDSIVVCAGQEPERALYEELRKRGLAVQVIGGADQALELDARRAIEQGYRLASDL